jgi:hypothetical protein
MEGSHRGVDLAMSGRERGFFARSPAELLYSAVALTTPRIHPHTPLPSPATPHLPLSGSLRFNAKPTGSFLDSS